MEKIRSSYIPNNYGEVFESIIYTYPPIVAVELGILDGYSTYYIANAIKNNNLGHLYAYDLFEDYSFNHGIMKEVQEELDKRHLTDFVTLYKMDAFDAHKLYQDNSVHFLHVDLSNTGEIVRKIMEQWHKKIVHHGVILFEGGSEERDKIEWMKKFNKELIKAEIETNKVINDNYVYGTYLKFPSLSMLLKKR